MLTLSLKYLRSPSSPFKPKHARRALITQGAECGFHVDRMVSFANTNEGSSYWSAITSWLDGGTGTRTLYNHPNLISGATGTVEPAYVAVIRMLIIADYVQKNHQSPMWKISEAYSSYLDFEESVDHGLIYPFDYVALPPPPPFLQNPGWTTSITLDSYTEAASPTANGGS